jgi:hypothetical protein
MDNKKVLATLNTGLSADDALRVLEYPEVRASAGHDPVFFEQVAASKKAAVAAGNQVEAKRFWIVEAVAHSQLIFEQAFALMKEYKFYDAWCKLEQCELTIKSLNRHFSDERRDLCRIGYIETMVERWQALYPYKVFFSPEFLKKRVECGICGAKVSLRNPCGHEKGQIYDGELCSHKITQGEFLSLSFVEKPVQKYSVAFLGSKDGSGSPDHHDYKVVKYAIDRLASPYHGWRTQNETRTIPQSSLSHYLIDAHCPCGSGNEFSACCASKPQVVVPHLQFIFRVSPASELASEHLNV